LSEKSSLYYGAEVTQGSCARARAPSFTAARHLEGGKEVFVRLNEIVGGRDGGEEGGEGFQARILQQDECAQ